MDFFHIEIHDSHTHSHTQKMKYIVIGFCPKKGANLLEYRGLTATEASNLTEFVALRHPGVIVWNEPEFRYDTSMALHRTQLERECNQFFRELPPVYLVW